MNTYRFSEFFSLVGRIGADPRDSDDVRLHKSMLVMSTVMFLIAGLLWGLMYFTLGETAGWIPFGYGLFSLLSLIVFAVGMMLGRWRGLPVADIAVDGLNASYSNVAYIGLPLFLLAVGPASTPYVIIAATLTLMTLFACAVVAIEFGHHRHLGIVHALGKAATGVARNPVTAAPIAGLLWWLTGWHLPDTIARFTHLLGSAASPTALVAIGLFLAERPIRDAVTSRPVLALTATKLILHPAVTALIAYPLLGMSSRTAALAVAIAALPTGTGPFMIASFYARDGKVTSGTILLSTMLSAITIAAILHFLPH